MTLPRFSFLAPSNADWREMFEFNLFSVVRMIRAATGRLLDPQEIADVVALLASPRSANTTGSEFVVDSGFLKEL